MLLLHILILRIRFLSDTYIPECTCEKEPYVVCEGHACIKNTDIAIKPANQVTNPLVYAESDDALFSTKLDIFSPPPSINDSDSGDENLMMLESPKY